MENIYVLAFGVILNSGVQGLKDGVRTWEFGKDSSTNIFFRHIDGEIHPKKFLKINLNLPECSIPTYVALTLWDANEKSKAFYTNCTSLHVYCTSLPHHCRYNVIVKGIMNPKCKHFQRTYNTSERLGEVLGKSSERLEEFEDSVDSISNNTLCTTADCVNPLLRTKENPCEDPNCLTVAYIDDLQSQVKNSKLNVYSKDNNEYCIGSECENSATDSPTSFANSGVPTDIPFTTVDHIPSIAPISKPFRYPRPLKKRSFKRTHFLKRNNNNNIKNRYSTTRCFILWSRFICNPSLKNYRDPVNKENGLGWPAKTLQENNQVQPAAVKIPNYIKRSNYEYDDNNQYHFDNNLNYGKYYKRERNPDQEERQYKEC